MVRQRYPLILSEDNDDQKLRESDGPKDTPTTPNQEW